MHILKMVHADILPLVMTFFVTLTSFGNTTIDALLTV